MNNVSQRNEGGGEKLKEEKLEQLRKVFTKIILKIIADFNEVNASGEDINIEEYSKNMANHLVYEVKIRINNK